MGDDKSKENALMAAYIVRGFTALCSAILVVMVGWIAANIADVPVIKNQITNISLQISVQGAEVKQRMDDLETRMRALEAKVK